MRATLTSPSQLSPDQIDRWRQLMNSHPRNFHPQLTPEWARIVERAGRLVEVAEFETDGQSGFFGYERLAPTRAAPISGPFSDRQAILFPSDSSLDAQELLAACNLKRFRFDHVLSDDKWVESAQHYSDLSYSVCLDHGFSHYWERLLTLHRGWCQQLERKKRKLLREVGEVRFEFQSDSESVLRALIQWKRNQVAAAGFKNPFGLSSSQALIAETVKEQTPYFAGSLSALFAGRQLIAVCLGQRSEHLMNAWIPAYHPDFSSYSPGALLHLELLRRCSHEGILNIDLGRGENPLKIKLANTLTGQAIGTLHRSPWRQDLANRTFQTTNWLIRVSNARKWIRLGRGLMNNRTNNTPP